MTNPLTWAVSRLRDWQWRREFDRTPIVRKGTMLVRDFRGSLYCMGFDDTLLEVIALLKALPRDAQHGPVLAMIERLEGSPRD